MHTRLKAITQQMLKTKKIQEIIFVLIQLDWYVGFTSMAKGCFSRVLNKSDLVSNNKIQVWKKKKQQLNLPVQVFQNSRFCLMGNRIKQELWPWKEKKEKKNGKNIVVKNSLVFPHLLKKQNSLAYPEKKILLF